MERYKRAIKRGIAALGLAVLAAFAAAGCSRDYFAYTPNPPLYPNGPRYTFLKAAVLRLRDFTIPLTTDPPLPPDYVNLAQGADNSWPKLSPEVLRGALIREISASGLVASAAAQEDRWAAVGNGDYLVVTGDVAKAGVERPADNDGRLDLDIDLKAELIGKDDVIYDVMAKSYHEEAAILPQSEDANAAANAALGRLYSSALRDLDRALAAPNAAARLKNLENTGSVVAPEPGE
ncbi:MAG: hypothetical protein ACYCPQ_05370 [Elusimicrobiota bacterium]